MEVLKETSPQLFERKFLPISAQLQRVIDIAKDLELDFGLIHTKKGAKRRRQRSHLSNAAQVAPELNCLFLRESPARDSEVVWASH